MDIKAAEISAILKDQIKNFGQEAEVSEVGQVLSVGDGIARVYGLDNVQAGELVEFPGGIKGMALNLESRQCRRRDLRQRPRHQGRRHRQAHRLDRRYPGRQGPARPRRRCAGQSDRRQGPDPVHRAPPRRRQGAGHPAAQIGARADVDRPQGDRRADPDRPRPARADHRRSPDRQDRGHSRHLPQPEGGACRQRLGNRQALLHLCRHRAEALDRGAVRQGARRQRRARILDRRRRDRLGRRRRCSSSRPSPAAPSANISATTACTP